MTNSLDQLGLDLLSVSNDAQILRVEERQEAELNQLRDYASQELNWARQQYDALLGISDAVEALPESLLNILATPEEVPEVPVRPMFEADGSHTNGLGSVPFDGYKAVLHKNEMVLPANIATHIRSSMSKSSKSMEQSETAVLIKAIEKLESQLQALREESGHSATLASAQRKEQVEAGREGRDAAKR